MPEPCFIRPDSPGANIGISCPRNEKKLFQDIIKKKRDGEELSSGEMTSLVRSFSAGEIPDYQMTAFLMAVCWRGMSSHETACLTEALLASGKTLPADSAPGRRIDKHSTGGVGDKVSLVLAPLVASMGVRVPMISGRALGHTGGQFLLIYPLVPGDMFNLPANFVLTATLHQCHKRPPLFY